MDDYRNLDLQTVRATARSDYEDMRHIACNLNTTVVEAGTEIDAELDRRMQKYLQGMTTEEVLSFKALYNREYNELFTIGLQRSFNKKPKLGELVMRTAVRATVWESVFALFRLFRG